MTINVLDVDIASGDKGDCFLCPIAKAIQRQYPNARVYVNYKHSHIFTGDKHLCFKTPIIAREFMTLFDSGNHVRELSFELEEVK